MKIGGFPGRPPLFWSKGLFRSPGRARPQGMQLLKRNLTPKVSGVGGAGEAGWEIGRRRGWWSSIRPDRGTLTAVPSLSWPLGPDGGAAGFV